MAGLVGLDDLGYRAHWTGTCQHTQYIHQMRTLVVIFFLSAIIGTCNLVSWLRKRTRRYQTWRRLQQLANSDDPKVRKQAAEDALALMKKRGQSPNWPLKP